MKSCYYKVNSVCGYSNTGDIVEAYEICKERTSDINVRALILLPKTKDECGCIVICYKDGTHKQKRLWVEVNNDSYLNLTNKQTKQLEKFSM